MCKKNYKVTVHAQGKAQQSPEQTLNLYFRLILGTETTYNNAKNKNHK